MANPIIGRYGIDGFMVRNAPPPPDPRTFRVACKRLLGVRVNGRPLFTRAAREIGGGYRSYHAIELEQATSPNLFVLVNIVYPLVAFTDALSAFEMRFRDRDDLREHFEPAFEVLDAADLAVRLKDAPECHEFLCGESLRWMRQFPGLTVGDVIFNEFD